jgi:hypothetical protein
MNFSVCILALLDLTCQGDNIVAVCRRWIPDATDGKQLLFRDDAFVHGAGLVKRAQRTPHAAGSFRVDPSGLQELEDSFLNARADSKDVDLVAIRPVVEDEAVGNEELHEGNDVAELRLLLTVGTVPDARHASIPLKPSGGESGTLPASSCV